MTQHHTATLTCSQLAADSVVFAARCITPALPVDSQRLYALDFRSSSPAAAVQARIPPHANVERLWATFSVSAGTALPTLLADALAGASRISGGTNGVPGVVVDRSGSRTPSEPLFVSVTDFCATSLAVSRRGEGSPLPLRALLGWALDLTSAVAHLTDNAVWHGCITGDSVGVRADGRLVLRALGTAAIACDSGAMRVQVPTGDGAARPALGGQSSPQCVAPEVHAALADSQQQQRGTTVVSLGKADVWAVGVLLHELATGSHPWPDGYPSRLVAAASMRGAAAALAAASASGWGAPSLPDAYPASLRAVLQWMAFPLPGARISAGAALRRLQAIATGSPEGPIVPPHAISVSAIGGAAAAVDEQRALSPSRAPLDAPRPGSSAFVSARDAVSGELCAVFVANPAATIADVVDAAADVLRGMPLPVTVSATAAAKSLYSAVLPGRGKIDPLAPVSALWLDVFGAGSAAPLEFEWGRQDEAPAVVAPGFGVLAPVRIASPAVVPPTPAPRPPAASTPSPGPGSNRTAATAAAAALPGGDVGDAPGVSALPVTAVRTGRPVLYAFRPESQGPGVALSEENTVASTSSKWATVQLTLPPSVSTSSAVAGPLASAGLTKDSWHGRYAFAVRILAIESGAGCAIGFVDPTLFDSRTQVSVHSLAVRLCASFS